MLRCKVDWVEAGEKATKHFLNFEKHNQNRKTLHTLISDNGQRVTYQKTMLQEQAKFYKDL